MYVDRLPILDAAELLRDRLDGLLHSEQLIAAAYQKAILFKPLLRALNRADRKICSIRKRREVIALFVPKDISVFPLNNHAVFEGGRMDMISSDALNETHPGGIDVFFHEQPWLELRGIWTEVIPVYAQYPSMKTFHQSRSIQRVGFDAFKTGRSGRLHYDSERRILRLSEPFDSDVMLVFEGSLLPGLIAIRDIEITELQEAYEDTKLNKMTVRTPPVYEDILIDTAMQYLVPELADPPDDRLIEARLQRSEVGNGPSVVIPEGKYEGFG